MSTAYVDDAPIAPEPVTDQERADLADEREAEEYEEMWDEVNSEMEKEYNSHGMGEFGFVYETDSNIVHAETMRRLRAKHG